MAALGQTVAISPGQSIKLNSASVTGAGTLDFYLTDPANAGDISAIFQVVGTLTTLTAALQVALDGVTFVDYLAAAAFLTTATSFKLVSPILKGAKWRINITVSTGGQDFWITCN